MDDADPDLRLRRSRLALEAIVSRSRPGTMFYTAALAAYLPLVTDRREDLIATLVAIGVQLAFAIARTLLYRRTARQREADPERWRTIFAVLATAVMFALDAFIVFELWQRNLDANSMLLITVSFVMRAGGTYAASLDRAMHRMWSRWSRVPLLFAPILLPTRDGLVLAAAFGAHMLYSEVQSKQLNSEFWHRIAATDSLAAAHDQLQREVAMRQRAEVELRLAQKLESVGRLATGIAHEINTPLQAMVGSLAFVDQGIGEALDIARAYQAALPEPVRAAVDPLLASGLAALEHDLPESLRLANECLERTATIVRSVKTFAHPNASAKSRVDVNAALATTLAIARHECAKVADVVTEFGALPTIEGYAGELNQAFLNIIVNAVHAMAPTGARGTRGTLGVTTRRDGDAIRIAISDTGVGIPDAIKDRIFDPFFTTKDVGKGTGQGLAIAHAVITQRHGGELTFESTLGRGTTFAIRIPIGPGELRRAA